MANISHFGIENQDNTLEDKEMIEILKTGTDLRLYAKQIDREFKDVEERSIHGEYPVYFY